KAGGGGPLKMLLWQAPTLLNPHFASGTKDQIASRVFYEPLAGWDKEGNLIYRKTARNFNPMMATAGRKTVVEVEEIVEVGELDPDQIHTPGIFVDRIVAGTFEKRIEKRTTRAA
ncbi:MAG: CoA-transferase, partial [Pannonibacter indicus]